MPETVDVDSTIIHRSFFTVPSTIARYPLALLSHPKVEALKKTASQYDMVIGANIGKGTKELFLVLHHGPPTQEYSRKHGNKAFVK